MNDKEAIERAASEYERFNGEEIHRNMDFKVGASWAFEQQANRIRLLEGLLGRAQEYLSGGDDGDDLFVQINEALK